VSFGVVSSAAAGAYAQQPPGPPPAIQVPPPTLPRAPEPPQVTPGEIPASPAPEAGAIPPGADRVTVTPVAITLRGGTVYSNEQLAPLIQPLIGKPVPASEIFKLAAAIERKYRDDGYFLSIVRVPPQRVADGRIVLQVVEGHISNVVVEGTAGPVQEKVHDYLNRLVGISPVRVRDLERYLLLANDLPGVRVKSVLRPGSEPGASELVGEVTRKPVDMFSQVDNRGSAFAGPAQGTFVPGVNSFTSLGERLEGTFFTTFNSQSVFGQVAASAAIGSEGFRIRGYGGAGYNQPGGALQTIQYQGHITVAGVLGAYPIIRSRDLNWNVAVGGDLYNQTVDAFGGTARLFESYQRAVFLSTDANYRDEWQGVTWGNIRGRKGLPGFMGGSSNTSPLLPRAGMDVGFLKVAGDLARLQRLWTMESMAFSVLASFGWQYTDSILPANEKYFLGGDRYGRGYYAGEVTGDRAIGGSVELQFDVVAPQGASWPPGGLPVQFYAFYDWGQAWNLAPGETPTIVARSVGGGVRVKVFEAATIEAEIVRRIDLGVDGAAAAPLWPTAGFVRLTTRF
jgi:hemolysin activation/secretion protein